jgi:hypothetical protein
VWWRPFASQGGEAPSAYRRLSAADVERLDAQFTEHGRRTLLEL